MGEKEEGGNVAAITEVEDVVRGVEGGLVASNNKANRRTKSRTNRRTNRRTNHRAKNKINHGSIGFLEAKPAVESVRLKNNISTFSICGNQS